MKNILSATLVRSMLFVCCALSANSTRASLELALKLDSRLGRARSIVDSSARRNNGSIAATTDLGAEYVGDVPPALKSISQSSLKLGDKTLAYIKDGKVLKTDGDFSIAFWLKLHDSKQRYRTLLHKTGCWSFGYVQSDNKIEFRVLNGGKLEFPVTASFKQDWHHLAIIKEGTQYRLFLDGETVDQPRELKDELANNGSLYIGANSSAGANSLSAQLDELGIWSRVLSVGDVRQLFQGEEVLNITDKSKLTRIATKEFAAEITVKPYSTTLMLVKDGLPNAVIAIQKGNVRPEFAELIQKKLADTWGVTFPIREVVNHHDGDEHLILFGASNSNMLLRELAANNFVYERTAEYELRVFPQVLDWQRGVIYLGGRTAAQVEESVDRFLKRFPQPQALPLTAELNTLNEYKSADYYYKQVEKIYTDKDRDAPARVTRGAVRDLMQAYRDTGDESYADAMGKAISYMLVKYEIGKQSERNRPQTFTFYNIPQFVFLIENSSAFNAKHRRDAAELMRLFMEDAMDYWEMTTPARFYEQGQLKYLTNHYLFAARSAYHTSRYLLNRHAYEPARYWQTVADHVFAGVQDHPISPEDAAGYNFLVYRIFLNHALASGKYDIDFFRNERYGQAVNFAKMIINHLGFSPGYGDAFAYRSTGSFQMLVDALDILNDEECAFLIDLMAQRLKSSSYTRIADIIKMDTEIQPLTNPQYFGLNALKLDDFLLSQYSRFPAYRRPVLNKAIFRSGWEITSDFLAINGLTSAPHGHDDATGISQYIHGEHLWLFEGHYIHRHAEDHNVLNVIRDGMVPDRRRYFKPSPNMAAQIMAETQSEKRNFALLTLLLEKFNGVNQYRRFAWERDGGFWVVDAAVVSQPGSYTLINQFRSTGKVTDTTQGFVVTQKRSTTPDMPYRLAISEGSGSITERYAKRESCHGRASSLLAGYRLSDQITQSLLQRQSRTMNRGDIAYFFNYLSPLSKAEAPIEIRRLADNAYLALNGTFPRLAVIGDLDLPQLKIKANACFIAPYGVLAEKATEIVIGEQTFQMQPNSTSGISFKNEAERETVRQILTTLANSNAKSVPSPPATVIDVPQKEFTETITFKQPISALTVKDGTVAVGLTDGSFKLLNADGSIIVEHKYGGKINAIAHIEAGAKSRWIIGVNGKFLNSSKKVSSGRLYALDDTGKELWHVTVPLFSGRYGNVTTIFPAYLDGRDAEPSIVIGAESWSYLAFDLAGKKRWHTRCTHGACGGSAGDLNGNGKDEVFMGNEYYVHAIIDASGKQVDSSTTSPVDIDSHIFDLNGDGKNEIVVGRNDGYLYVDGLGSNPLIGKQLNIGGQPKNLVKLDGGQKSRIAVAAMSGVVTFVGPALERIAYHVLPTTLTAMAAKGELLYTTAFDNFVYELNESGITAKLPFRYNPASLEQPRAAGSKSVLAVGSDKTLYLLK